MIFLELEGSNLLRLSEDYDNKNKQMRYVASFSVKNVHVASVAFKVKTTHPKEITVNPFVGIMEANTTARVRVSFVTTQVFQSTHTMYPENLLGSRS
jgi:MSP (Major sperm protein) domain